MKNRIFLYIFYEVCYNFKKQIAKGGKGVSFSEKVNRLLKENGMTKAALAKESGIPYTTLDSMLKRETDTARLTTVFRIAKALGTSVEALVFDEAKEPELSPEEKRILSLYGLLDSRGRSTVLSLLEQEADNSAENDPKRAFLPVFEAPAAAGAPLPVLTEEYSAEPRPATPAGASFAIRISGDSMEPLFSNGDLAYVEQTEEIAPGQIGVFLLNGESLIKEFSRREGETYLVSLNPRYAPIHVLESDRMKLVGRVMTEPFEPHAERSGK